MIIHENPWNIHEIHEISQKTQKTGPNLLTFPQDAIQYSRSFRLSALSAGGQGGQKKIHIGDPVNSRQYTYQESVQ